MNGEQVSVLGQNGVWRWTNVYAGNKQLATYYGSATYFPLTDWLGTKRVEVNLTAPSTVAVSEQCTSLPFGDALSCNGTDTNQLHFTGKERDTESDNDYFGARYYASNSAARFLTPDWSAKVEPVPYVKLDNPQSLNLYSYVGNNPLSFTDPTGHYVCSGSKDQCAQIQDGLNLAKAAQAKLRADSKEGKAIGAVLKFYGAAGKKNGVNVSFGNLDKGTLGETTAGPNGTVNIKFDLGQINSFAQGSMPGTDLIERGGTAVHEGRHGVGDRAAGHGPENRHEEMQTERNAYRTQSYFYQGLGVETPTGLWSPSWSPANAEQNRNVLNGSGVWQWTNVYAGSKQLATYYGWDTSSH